MKKIIVLWFINLIFVSNILSYKSRTGVHLLYADPGDKKEKIEKSIEKIRKLNIKWVRVGFIWALANPSPENFNFEFYDWLFGELKNNEINILVAFAWTPKWCSSNKESDQYYLYPPNGDPVYKGMNGFYFLYLIAKEISLRYKGIVDYWEFWNEPDMEYFLKDSNGNRTSADEYSKMLYFFYKGIKDGNPDAKVLIGGLAQGFEENSCDLKYLDKLFSDKKYPAHLNYDIHNIHTNFKSIEEIKKQISMNRKIFNKYNIKKEIWITESSYSPLPKFQILEDYQGGEYGFNKYIFEVIITELLNVEGIVFWTPFYDYGEDVQKENPYKYNGLLTFNLEEKKAAKIFKYITEFFIR